MTKNVPLTNFEPYVKLQIQPATAFAEVLKKNKLPVPKPITILGLIDTGFTGGLAINQPLVKDWGLSIRNFNEVVFPRDADGRIYRTYAWEAEIAVRFLAASRNGNNVEVDPIAVTLFEFVDERQVQALIGQELLQAAVFTYNGPGSEFSLEFDDDFGPI